MVTLDDEDARAGRVTKRKPVRTILFISIALAVVAGIVILAMY